MPLDVKFFLLDNKYLVERGIKRVSKPESWPDHLPFARVSHSLDIPLDVLRLLMFVSEEKKASSSLFDEKLVHSDIQVRDLSHFVPDHPLAGKKTLRGRKHYGVFAKREIPAGEILGEYVGRIYYFSSSCKNKTKFSEYKWTIVHPHYTLVIDSQYGANELSLINDYRGIADSANVTPSLIPHNGCRYFSYVTTKTVHVGEELLVDYGSQFWSAFQVDSL